MAVILAEALWTGLLAPQAGRSKLSTSSWHARQSLGPSLQGTRISHPLRQGALFILSGSPGLDDRGSGIGDNAVALGHGRIYQTHVLL
ncbi:hypothetical protein GGP41_007450 [Bipolaris sorokiniana]|uniref:Uncharacterized protein n=1 Tax=Cochliobolus sativus TaxID=45130 RepID=A0A8H5ZT56_COCSA|nr:hypothetical protein GGP41_007450 [Bipolaris sorokiniana]